MLKINKSIYLVACLAVPAMLFAQTMVAPCPTDLNQAWSHCLGVIKKEGGKYSGEFLNNLFHGRGMYFFESGDYYSGAFKEGVPHGWGIYVFATENNLKGDRYVGEFKDGFADGRGTTFFKLGSVYFGKYAFGLPDGLGTFIHQDGITIYEGEWLKGKFIKPALVENQIVQEFQRTDESVSHIADLNAMNKKVNDLQDELMQLKITEVQLRQKIETLQQTLLVQSKNSTTYSEFKNPQPPVHPIVELKNQQLKINDAQPSVDQEFQIQLIRPIKAPIFRKKTEVKKKPEPIQSAPDPMKDAFLYLQ